MSAAMPGGAMAPMGSMSPMAGPDLNDVDYDAYLANERTLDDPEVIRVERNGEVRLRIINAGASSNFTIDLGSVQGALVAVDGNPIVPLPGRRFPVAIAQRADIVLRMPTDGSAVPILALGEGRRLRAGVILQPPGAAVAKLSTSGSETGPQVRLAQELELRASAPLAAKPADRSIPVDLTGTMMGYVWAMPIHGMAGLPGTVERGERVEIAFRNTTMMSHPMHLHGHVFQVVEIDGKQIAGAIRDTMLVPPKAAVKVAFDADNPGLWAFHCHNLYHMAAGMFSMLVYRGFA
jgi:FtsP/CotA-like multicopper oxidase with cupredoxin domain